MKLNARDAEAFFARPDPKRAGLLIYGADAMRVALKRQHVLKNLLGENAEEEMRLTRVSGAELRKDPALLLDAVKATGFFPGQRAVFVEETPDGAHPAMSRALEDWAEGDAFVLATAGALKPASKLRKLFEGHKSALVAAIYDDPPSRAEIERVLAAAELKNLTGDAIAAMTSWANDLSPGDFAQMAEKVALFKLNDPSPLSMDDIDACAPQSTEAGTDALIHAVAEGRREDVGPLIRRLQGQGVNAVSLCINTMRHFRMLYTAASDPGGAAAGVGRLRPPVFGPRRDKIVRQAQTWGTDKLESALISLTDTDLLLRSAAQTAPAMAVMERALIRLSMLARQR